MAPEGSARAIVLPRPSVSKLLDPAESVRENTWSIPNPVSRLAVATLAESCSWTTLAPSYRYFVVLPPTVLLTRLPTPS
jgi:hypothetical protein